MISMIGYNECYDEQLMKLDMLLFFKAKYHPDVIKETMHLAVDGEVLVGIAFLLKKGSFLAIETAKLQYHELFIEYGINSEYAGKELVFHELMEKMKEACNRISASYPEKRILIKAWAYDEDHELIKSFLNHGFYIGRGTPVMRRNLLDCPEIDTTGSQFISVTVEGETKQLELKKLDMNEKLMESYKQANGNAFLIPDSVGDIWFKLNAPDVKIFAAMNGEQVIASVMIWNIDETTAATENIFCLDTFRRKGITGNLINYVCAYLKQQGFKEASLTVYQDNIAAYKLYEKLGYRYRNFMFGLQYESSYKCLPY